MQGGLLIKSWDYGRQKVNGIWFEHVFHSFRYINLKMSLWVEEKNSSRSQVTCFLLVHQTALNFKTFLKPLIIELKIANIMAYLWSGVVTHDSRIASMIAKYFWSFLVSGKAILNRQIVTKSWKLSSIRSKSGRKGSTQEFYNLSKIAPHNCRKRTAMSNNLHQSQTIQQ